MASDTVVARGLLNRIQESAGYLPVFINFSAQTSSARTQEVIESKLEKKRKNILGNKKLVVFVDDLNMPKLDSSGSQPPIELLRNDHYSSIMDLINWSLNAIDTLKSHYVFNLRDLSKCVQGILQCEPSQVRDKTQIFRLFCHECQRVFHDRLINTQDKTYFNTIICEMASKNSHSPASDFIF
ncbi:dynein heavy chain 6, axonemal-like [Astatotilapia calliptera]|uniref:dynein heavy chain 6, axonemal-like n=1 Tax=Astatotilapia calliptera TaxID=8154 RepID=UPI000E4124E6|nr:dynein heavy chain 6, axonemal-like [Astatotilapia calliptera]